MMSHGTRARPRLLDLFCGAGGASVGYHRAGFDVVGVDIKPQPHYPFEFHQADALEWLSTPAWETQLCWDAIHASPPCQDHSMLRNSAGTHGTGWLLDATLERLRRFALPWVVENVVGAPLPQQATLDGRHGVTLCGASFGLGASGMDLPRHRLFECSFPVHAPACSHREGETMGVYGHGNNASHRERLGRNLTVAEMREAMGIDWMTREELSQAIPPAYTQFVGEQLLAAIGAAA
jgi:DNA (cytosine-5)-methyltransferase 1